MCMPDTTLHMCIKHQAPHASMPVDDKLHHFHCERALSFIASVFERILNFGARVPKVRIHSSTLAAKLCRHSVASSTLAVKLCRRSVASSMLAVKLCCRSVASSMLAVKLRVFSCGEYSKPRLLSKLRCDHCRSFNPFEWVAAAILSQFFFFLHAETRSRVLASLTAC